jgi:hypothetical protein
VPATSAVLIAFFSSFFAAAIKSMMQMMQTRQPVRAIKQSIYLYVYALSIESVVPIN